MTKLIVLSILFFSYVSIACADTGATVSVRPENEVSGQNVLISDISSVRSDSSALAAKLRSAQLCPSPSPGRTRVVTRDDIVIAIRRAGVNDRIVDVLCPKRISVVRSFRRVTGESIFESAKNYAASSVTWPGTIDIQPVRMPADVETSLGKMELRVKPGVVSIRKGQNSVYVDIVVDGKVYRTVSCTICIKLLAKVLVATQPISKSDPATSANTSLEERDITTIPDDITIGELASGMVASVPIGAGTIIKKSWLVSPPVVHSGDDVLVTVAHGSLRVSEKGTAAQDGGIGQTVKVRLLGVRDVRAKVLGPGRVEIEIAGRG